MAKMSIICQIILIHSVLLAVHSTHEDCAVGKYLCKNEVKKCIDLTAICDGKLDCPDGEDESSSYCKDISAHYKKYNPGNAYVHEADHYVNMHEGHVQGHIQHKTNTHNETDQGDRYWPNNGCGAGNYLCNGTLNICVKLVSICDGVQDCPQNDDESQESCKNRNPIAHKTFALDVEPAILLDQSGNNERNFDGSGFMFHVDNLIIYNSDVKMFNQNSDNEENAKSTK